MKQLLVVLFLATKVLAFSNMGNSSAPVSATYTTAPYLTPLLAAVGSVPALTNANDMRCYSWVPAVGVVGATKVAWAVTGTGAGNDCAVCVYSGDGATLIAAASTTAGGCNPGSGIVGVTGITAFNLVAGTKYRVCWSADNNTQGWQGATPSAPPLAVVNQFVSSNMGSAANPTTGTGPLTCPATTGNITNSTLTLPFVLFSVE